MDAAREQTAHDIVSCQDHYRVVLQLRCTTTDVRSRSPDKLRADKHAYIPRRVQMKISNTARLITLAAVSVLASTACTSTRTQKSAGETIDDGVISTEVNTALVW